MVGPGRLVFAVAVVAALAACGESSSSSGGGSNSSGSSVGTAGANLGTAAVKVSATDGQKFDPAQTTAKVGDVIEWTNSGSINHTVTFDDQQSLSDPSLSAGGTWQVRFNTAGTYQYHCTIHAGMNGSITVS